MKHRSLTTSPSSRLRLRIPISCILAVLALLLGMFCGVQTHAADAAANDDSSTNATGQNSAEPAETYGSRTVNFNRNWLFRKGDHPNAKEPGYDATEWQKTRLPHDWAIAGPFDPQLDGSTGKLPWRGVGWYRKSFALNCQKEDRVYLDFDGVMAFPEVYINGQLAGSWDYGYTSFRIDVTPFIKPGEQNVVAVRVDTRKFKSRWYPGAGIYRKVVLHVCEPVHFAHWGIVATTPTVSDEQATVRIRHEIDNHRQPSTSAQLRCVLIDPDGKIASSPVEKTVRLVGKQSSFDCEFEVSKPRRWDVSSPFLYRVRSSLLIDGKVSDEQETSFGIRTFKFTPDDGFHLNGRRVQLYGVNLHHDHGPLGAVFNTRAMQRQLEIMQEMGANAVRTSHNPSAPELLELCDAMGILVWDECFDKWDATAGRVDGKPSFEAHGAKHLGSLVRRDRNHPSVVVWSIGNEIGNQPSDREGKSSERVKAYADMVRSHDPTRPVTIGCFIPETARTPILQDLDLTGWNYARRYALFRELYPQHPIVYSESASTLSTRGHYEFPFSTTKSEFTSSHQVSSYDLNSASWSDIPDIEFRLMESDPFVAGEFVWTGFDYLGEPTPFPEIARSSYFGIVDLCGIPKDRYYLYRSLWRPEANTLHVVPHWTWPERVGKNVPVFVYTNSESAELFVNGVSQGRRSKGDAPARPTNFVLASQVSCSSIEGSNVVSLVNDGNPQTRWCAADDELGHWCQADFGQTQPVKFLALEFEKEAKYYGYQILVSEDQLDWTIVIEQPSSRTPRWGGPKHAFHEVDFEARYVRIKFADLRSGAWASLREFEAYPDKVESMYYRSTYDYRLRWNDVTYEPGELTVVAYDGGSETGRVSVKTAQEPTAIRLTADRTELSSSGEDLSYVLVEAIDRNGVVCPDADNTIRFKIDGPATIAGVGNGNPLSLAPFQSSEVALFHGKAMLILRTLESEVGPINIEAESDGLSEAKVLCRAE